MAQERPNRLAEWLTLLRQNMPVVRERFDTWFDEVRDEPWLLWETAAVRYATYAAGGLLAIWLVTSLVGSLAPAPPPTAREAATTADFHVICTNPDCGHHFVIHRKFGFHKFPVQCPACQKETGFAARRCNSRACQGRWVVPVEVEGVPKCPECGTKFE